MNDLTPGPTLSKAAMHSGLHGIAKRLVENGVLTDAQATVAENTATELDVSLLQHVVDSGLVESGAAALAAAWEYGLPVVDLDAIRINALPPANDYPVKILERLDILPLARHGHRLTVAVTQFTVNLSDMAQKYWLQATGTLFGSIMLLKAAARRSPRVAYRLDSMMLHLPILGDILHKSAVSRFTRTLATTFTSGVPLIEGLETAAGASDNRVYIRAINEVRQDVTTGQQLHFAMRMTNRFPALAVQMVNIGEEAGSLDAMLNRVADYYEEEVDNKVDALTSLMEPIIIVVLGALVGGVVVSMYLPIFEIGTAL